MAEQRYVRTDSTAGGDGTEDRTDGATRAYPSLSVWESSEQKDITSIPGGHIVTCSAPTGVADIGTTINSWITDATHYVLIEAAITDYANKELFNSSLFTITESITINDNHVRLKGIQFNTSSTAITISSLSVDNKIIITDCRQNGTGRLMAIADIDAIVDVFNCICDGGSRVVYVELCSLVTIANCIAYGSGGDGIEFDAGTGTITNCALFNNGDDFDIDGSASVTIDHCASDDPDGTNRIVPYNSDWSEEYANPATGDFTQLLGNSNCYHGGINISGLTLDIEGDAYHLTTPSVGVDEYVIASTGIEILRRRIGGY